jgi:uncharacterized delta-60 repeat protein
VAGCVAIQPDGKIVAGGYGSDGFAVARYNTDGSPDNLFSGDGKVLTDFTSGLDLGLCTAVGGDGKIVVVGAAADFDTFAVARYNTDGSLDNTFSNDGKTRNDLSPGQDGAYGVVIQPDGKIVAVGFSDNSTRFAAARYNVDGSLDTSFSGDGKVRNDIASGNEYAVYAALQPNGRIVAAGVAGGANTGNDTKMAFLRYNTNGTLDTSFSSDGKLRTDFSSGFDYAGSLAIQTDGRIVAAGGANDDKFAVARYNTNGTLDTSFSNDGKTRTDFTSGLDVGGGVGLEPDGKIVVGGLANSVMFALARYNVDGTLDGSFGAGGKVTTQFSEGPSAIYGVAIQSDGNIVAGGFAGGSFGLARYLDA